MAVENNNYSRIDITNTTYLQMGGIIQQCLLYIIKRLWLAPEVGPILFSCLLRGFLNNCNVDLNYVIVFCLRLVNTNHAGVYRYSQWPILALYGITKKVINARLLLLYLYRWCGAAVCKSENYCFPIRQRCSRTFNSENCTFSLYSDCGWNRKKIATVTASV